MDTQRVFLILLDVSGYTKFIRFHKFSLFHAERIIDELLESVIAEAQPPLVLHELEGDAVYFYVMSDGSREMGQNVCSQVERRVAAFRRREAELISACGLCRCDACKAVGQLTLKVVLHHGEAVFTQVRQFRKVSGEDVILAHRLLKNSITQNEYTLVTEKMHELLGNLGDRIPEPRVEDCRELGRIEVRVYYPSQQTSLPSAARATAFSKLRMLMKVEWHLLKRLVMPASKRYRNLDTAQR